jgi:hypothetical protein
VEEVLMAEELDTKELVKEESVESHYRWQLIALVYGFNTLAKEAKTLAEKVYFRMARDHAEDELKTKGVGVLANDSSRVLELPESGPPYIRFGERDIELMRETVRKYDEAHKSNE